MRHLLTGSAVAGLLFLLPVGDANAQDNRNSWGWGAAGGVLTFIAGGAVGGILGWRLSKLASKAKRDDNTTELTLTQLNSSVKVLDGKLTKLETNSEESIQGLSRTLESKMSLGNAMNTVSTSLETVKQHIIEVKEMVKREMKKEDSQIKMIENHNQLRPIIIETNAIIDGRIVNLLNSDLLEELKGKILITKLMKDELDRMMRQPECMGRGYKNLDRLRSNINHRIEKNSMSYDGKTVDEKLMQLTSDTDKRLLEGLSDADKKFFLLASDTNGILVTMDVALVDLCRSTNIRVLNLDELYKTIKPEVFLKRGEEVYVKLKPSRNPNRAIADYQDTMILVEDEDAAALVGEKKLVRITSDASHSRNGRTALAKLSSPGAEPPTVEAKAPQTPPAP